MSPKATDQEPSDPSEKSQNQIIREAGYNDFKEFILSHNLRMYNDDDVQLGKQILDDYREHDRILANNANDQLRGKTEHWVITNEAYNPDSHADPSCRVPVSSEKLHDEYSRGQYGLDRPYSHFEWGVDEPEFEDYPDFSDEENGYDGGHASYDGGYDGGHANGYYGGYEDENSGGTYDDNYGGNYDEDYGDNYDDGDCGGDGDDWL